MFDEALNSRLRRVKLFLTDVDGVLTDAGVVMGGGFETKRFDIRDGLGIKLLQRCGFRVGWVSARPSQATNERAADLGVDLVLQSSKPKAKVIAELLEPMNLSWEHVLFMGDDILDLGPLRRAGFSAATADAHPEVKSVVHYICQNAGGRGAVREVVELLLKAHEKWDPLLAEFAS
jgi:3-deoxy-D-manno-octulosonate 8-phosphate phosphatase (KDO 8-P phosphatase)